MDLQTAVNALLEHTGVGDKLAAAEVARRNAACAEARTKKRAATTKFLAERDHLQALLNAADDKQKSAQKAAETAMLEWISLREKFSQVHDELTSVSVGFDATLRQNQDPAIAAFADELAALKQAASGLYRATPAGDGTYTDNRAAVNARIRAIGEVAEATERLKVDPNIDNVAAEITRLRNSIPKA